MMVSTRRATVLDYFLLIIQTFCLPRLWIVRITVGEPSDNTRHNLTPYFYELQ